MFFQMHSIPLSAVPCMDAAYRQKRHLNEEGVAKIKKDPTSPSAENQEAANVSKIPLAGTLVDSKEVFKTHVTSFEFRDYCMKRIPHETKEIIRYRRVNFVP